MLHQKVKNCWILEGDANSNFFFHSWIKRRSKSNEIDGLVIQNVWTDSVDGVRRGIFDHFKNHFCLRYKSVASIPPQLFHNHIDDVDNNFLEAPFTKDEVKKNIWE